MPRTTTARADAIATAARLFHRQGYHGTGLAQVLEESGAPKGSFYFHFPGGKEELALEAIAASSAEVQDLLVRAAERAGDASDIVIRSGRSISCWLTATRFQEGCAVATLAAEASGSSEPLRDACERAYASWRQILTDGFARHGVAPHRAAELANLAIAALEGATLIARVEQRADAIDRAVALIASLIRNETARR
jgi:TetR/AcrR family transcriptional repressor of lmrAB and yxaGH operons